MSIQQMLLGASGASGYLMDKSLRFRRSAGAFLNRTPAGAGNVQIMTLSFWFKRGTLGVAQYIFGSYLSGSFFSNIYIESTDQIGFVDVASSTNLLSTQVFRDPSAWYHIVVAFDTTQATAANRVKFYVNGVQITAFAASTYPAQNTNLNLNNAINHTLFNNAAPGGTLYTDGYLAEVNFVNAQQLTPASFGETNALTGVWQPKAYTGTYGTNGFYLDFEDTSSVAALGTDSSGNGNTWTVNNISLTAGVTYDSMTDVPTLTSATAANYAVFNPLAGSSNLVLSNGNLTASGVGSGVWNRTGNFAIPFGQWYWEVVATGGGGADAGYGIFNDPNNATGSPVGIYLYLAATGTKYAGVSTIAYGATWTTNDIIGIAFDSAAGSLTFYKNGVSQGVAFTRITGTYFPVVRSFDTIVNQANFGQRPFTYTPPTGFVALNTFNLPDATIKKGSTVMDATLYTGNGSTQTITNAASFQPDLVWAKDRSANFEGGIYDSVRGTGTTSSLTPSSTRAESGNTTDFNLTSFNSNGFSLGTTSGTNVLNRNGDATVGWQWKANGAAVSNTSGTITSQVSANASAGFSIVTTTGTGANATVGHGLGVAPEWVIVKSRSATNDWFVGSSGLTNWSNFLKLNTGDAQSSLATIFNSTAPTSSVFSLGTASQTNGSGTTYVAYCFAPIAGFSAIGKYAGNQVADGTFVYLGFRPKFVIIKDISNSSQNWFMFDSSRSPYNLMIEKLFANLSNGEDQELNNNIDFLSNGFKLRTANVGTNAIATMVYLAFAENPFKNSLAR